MPEGTLKSLDGSGDKRIAVFMGTRPEAIKLAPVVKALQAAPGMLPVVISTGQHREMLAQIVETFGLSVARDLAVMRPDQDLASLTARLISAADLALADLAPDLVLVQGDTASVWCAGLAAFYRRIPVGHVEAGLRTGDRYSPFPEEINRRLAAPLATLHFAATEEARRNLLREGVAEAAIEVTGNTVIDALLMETERLDVPAAWARESTHLAALLGEDWESHRTILVTAHRRENFGAGLAGICDALALLAARFADHRIVYPVHLNPNVRDPVHARLGAHSNIQLVPPLGYSPFVALLRSCRLVLTDSGGIQEEAPSLGKPVLVMRDTTERPEGIAAGTAQLVGTDAAEIAAAASHLLTDAAAYAKMARAVNPYGDGQAAGRVVKRIARLWRQSANGRRSGMQAG